jgi:hypothetical protein
MYRKCPYCGANLDPGEICDCKKEAAPDVEDPEAAQVNDFTDILAKKQTIVKEEVKPMAQNAVYHYESATIDIHFPEGHVCCDLCPLLETYARKQCRRTGEYLLDTRVTVGWQCPLNFGNREEE